jgi:trk system potassium uptake protein TrkA
MEQGFQMNIIVVGCGRVGSELAYQLNLKGHNVTVIDQVDAAFDNLPPDFRGRTVEGEVLNQNVLRRAGIEQVDGVAAVTNSDALNAVVAHVARTVYDVARVVVRNYDPNWRRLHEAFGFQIVSSTSWGAQRIEELLYDAPVSTVFSAGNGEVEIYEFVVPEAWTDHLLQDLLPTEACVAVALTRAGRAILPACDSRLAGGDVIHVSATWEGIEALRNRLTSVEPTLSESKQSHSQGSQADSPPQEA